MPIRLVERSPVVPPGALIAGLVPPPLFRDARLSTYRPDPAEPTQQFALSAVGSFAAALDEFELDDPATRCWCRRC